MIVLIEASATRTSSPGGHARGRRSRVSVPAGGVEQYLTRTLAALIAIFLLVSAAVIDATVVVPADLGVLARAARTIVRGRVVELAPRWTAGRERIETLLTLEVVTCLKGAAAATVTMAIPGGQVGRYRSIVVGAPRFAVGQHVVLFLGGEAARPHLLGLSQGVFRVAAAPSGSVVLPPALISEPGRTIPLVRGTSRLRPMSLEAFEDRVRQLAEGLR